MKIHTAEFVKSAANSDQYPPPELSEIAFAGKSNVGKSTLINSLLNRKGLVKTSSTPGKTQLINFFRINDDFQLVDLPGYGYAKVPTAVQRQWQPMIEGYLSDRAVLKGVVLIIDVRHGPNNNDKQMKEWLDYYEKPVLVIANKMDKLKRGQYQKQLKLVRDELGLASDPLPHSSLAKMGKDAIWGALQQWF
jgi:GTP-binding protein